MAAVLSALLLALFVWWFQPNLPVLAGYALLAFVAIFTVPLLYRQTGFTLEDELDWLEEREEQEHRQLTQRLRELRDELDRLDIREGVSQATRLSAMLDDYHAVVETRFIGKKNSPIAYLSTARRVQKHAIQNLNDVVAVGHSLSSISRNNSDDNDRSDSRREKFERLNREQSDRLEGLLIENRKLFDALTDTAVEVANISSFSEFERLDTLARLVTMSEIASQSGK